MASWSNIITACFLLTVVCLSTVTCTIFPDDDFGYRHYAKREISSDCLRCARTYNYAPCLRCWNTKYAVIPFHSKRSSDDSSIAETGSDMMSRDRRYTGCNCCFTSRFLNTYCCDVCNTATKRMGKRDSTANSLVSEPVKRMNPACLCCAAGGDNSQSCCNECLRRNLYY